MDLRFDDDAIPLSPHEQQRRERLRQYDYIIPSSFQQPHESRYTFVCDPSTKPALEKCPSVTHFHQYHVPHAERVISLDTPSTSSVSTLWQDVITEASLACIPERLMRNGRERVLSDMDDMTPDTPTPTTPETHDIYQHKNDTVFSFMCNVNHRASSPTFPHIDDTPTPQEQQHDHDHLKVPGNVVIPSPRISTRTITQQPLRVTTTTPRVVGPTPTPRLISRPTPRVGGTPRISSMPTPRLSHFPLIDDTEVKPHPVTRVDSFPLESPAQITNRPLLHVSIPTTVLEPVTPTATSATTTATTIPTPTSTSSTSTLPPRPTPRVASIRSSPRLVPIDVKAPPTTPLMSPTYKAVATSSSSGYRSPYVAVETERDVQGLQKYLDTPHRPEMEDEIKTLPPDHALNESIEPWINTEPILSSSTVYYRKLEETKNEEKQSEMIHSDSMVSLSDLARSSSSSNLFMFEASCAICLSSRCDCILLPCSHSFHASCILSWVDSTHGRQFSCPLCRQSIEQLIPISRSSPSHRPTHSRRASSVIPDTNPPIEMRHHDDCDIPTISKRHPKIDTIVTSHSSAYDELLHRFTQSWERYYYQGDTRDKNEDNDGGEQDVILKKGTQIVLDDHEAEQLITQHDTQEYISEESSPSQSIIPSTSSHELLYDDLLPDVFYIPAELPEISDTTTTSSTATLYIPFSTIMSQHLHIHTEQTIQPQVVTWRSPFSSSITQLIHAIHNDRMEREISTSTSTTSSLLTLGTSPLYAGAIAGLACSLSSIIFGSSAARAASATTAARASLANVSSLGRQWATALQTMRTTIPSVAIYFLSYETMKKILVHDGEQPSSLQYMTAATTAGAISNFRHLRTHPTIPLRFGAQFAFFEQIKNRMSAAQDGQPLYASQVLAAAAAGGLVAYSLEHPIANAWTTFQQRHDPKPIPAPAPRAVLSSLPMQLMRSLPTCAITAVTFEMAHRYMQKNGHNTSIQIQRQSSPPPKPSTSEAETKPDSVSSMWFGDLTM